MSKLIINGDSFARPDDADFAWTNQLGRHYDTIYNIAESGTGFDYHIDNFLKIYDDKNLIKEETDIIWIITSWHRWNFPFLREPLHQSKSLDKTFYQKHYKKKLKFINEFLHYKFNGHHKRTHIIANSLLIKFYSREFRKIILWSAFELFTDVEYAALSDMKCHVAQETLMDFTNNTHNDIAHPDYRVNHMDVKYHNKLYDYCHKVLL